MPSKDPRLTPRVRLKVLLTPKAAALLPGLVLAVLLLGLSPEKLLAETLPQVTPGTVVRMSGLDLDACGIGTARWKPLSGQCFFPIGLRKTGTLTLVTRRGGQWQERKVEIGDYPYPVQHLTIKDDGQVNLSKESLARVQKENKRIGAVLWGTGGARFELPLGKPLAKLPEGGRFGSKRFMNGQAKSPHSGADYAAVEGTPVMAVADGKVVLAEEHFFGGNSVFIDHGDQLVSMVLHLSEILVEKGQDVSRGQVIGKVGSTGRSTGAHLHLGLRWHGARVDPGPLFKSAATLATLDSP